jgi:hypothetical protein
MFGSTKACSVAFAMCALVFGGAVTLGVADPAAAQSQPSNVSQFLANPGALLTEFSTPNPSNPTDPMILRVRDLAAASPDTLTAILGLIAGASTAQKQAIGKGLQAAAGLVVTTNPRYANDIQVAVARTRDRELVLAYTSSDTATGATGGGGGGAPGGASGGQTATFASRPTSTGPAQPIGGSGTLTGPFSITSAVTGSSGTTSTVFQTVSP